MLDKKIKLKIELSEDLPIEIIFDENKLKQILFNLLSNSIKFINSGFILLKAEYKLKRLAFTILDTGIGIKPEFLPKIGKPYFKSEANNNAFGIRMGLYLVSNYVKNLKGNFKVFSEVDKCTVCLIELPYDKVEKDKSLENSYLRLNSKINNLNHKSTKRFNTAAANNNLNIVNNSRNNYSDIYSNIKSNNNDNP